MQVQTAIRLSLFIFASSTLVTCAKKARDEPAPAPAPERNSEAVHGRAADPAAKEATKPASRPKPDTSARVKPSSRPADAAPEAPRLNTCIVGQVETRGEMVIAVKNATVSVLAGEKNLGEAVTDENGKFVWCAPQSMAGMIVNLTVRVEKPPFAAVSQSRRWEVGVQEEFSFAFDPPKL